MAFKNEYIPPIEQEISEFAKQARKAFNTGHSKYDKWAIDRENQVALIHVGSGRKDPGDPNHERWELFDQDGYFVFNLEAITHEKLDFKSVRIVHKLLEFWKGDRYAKPNERTLQHIKDALSEYGKSYMFEMYAYESCDLTLLNGIKGEVV